ncbi:MAG: 4Fe-4S dicluster domain-containing protein [Deltaproteobacteria bacterium]|jgi:formate dehydrogenase iron-sulfur subunit|nr:4Fe-4S dicluster domain-containing protein [Deltaproteobacteria bacterium]
MPKSFLVDTTRCTACRGCQIACKEWHDLPANDTRQRGTHQNPPDLNPNNYKIVRFRERLTAEGTVIWNFFPDQCRHCLVPNCKDTADKVVPGAMIQDQKTGAVLPTEKSAALSAADARAVINACPYNIPRLDAKTNRLTKCDMCVDRVSNGMQPICVKTCPTGCMSFGEREEMLVLAQKRLENVKKRFPKAFLADYRDVNVIYLLGEEKEHYYEYAAFL